jgi:hypothetical protein
MEAIKFVMFYGLELTVVAVAVLTVLAGLFQLVRDRIAGRVSTLTTAPQTAKR